MAVNVLTGSIISNLCTITLTSSFCAGFQIKILKAFLISTTRSI